MSSPCTEPCVTIHVCASSWEASSGPFALRHWSLSGGDPLTVDTGPGKGWKEVGEESRRQGGQKCGPHILPAM